MKFNRYNLIARFIPALLSVIPFFVLHYFYLKPILNQFWGELLGIQIISDVTISFVFFFALVQISRYISKELFEKNMFDNGLSLPTTEYLLHLSSQFSPEYTLKVHTKIKADFGIEIPPIDYESSNGERSHKIITEAVSHIRAKVKEGNLTGQHNAEYGFARNMAGGTIIASVMSLINVSIFTILYPDKTALWVSIILAFLYITVMFLAKKMIISFGNSYAKILIQEYMSI